MIVAGKNIRKVISKIHPIKWKDQYYGITSMATKEEFKNFQEDYLRLVLLHAYRNVPFYQRVFSGVDLIVNEEVDLSQFHKIPILNKEIIKENWEDIISKERTKRKWFYNASGGSTGEPITIIQDDIYRRWGRATSHYYYNDMLGIDLTYEKKILLWGSERDLSQGGVGFKDKAIRWLNNLVFLNSFRMTEEDLNNYTKLINSYKPALIRGYAGALYVFGFNNYVEILDEYDRHIFPRT
ncbi:hypothetical protein ES703_53451 [subsurface metagenome]